MINAGTSITYKPFEPMNFTGCDNNGYGITESGNYEISISHWSSGYEGGGILSSYVIISDSNGNSHEVLRIGSNFLL